MKIQKFNENNQPDLRKCKSLFFELWDDHFNIANMTLLLWDYEKSDYKFFCKFYTPISNHNYIYWNQLFSMLENNGFDYSLDKGDFNIIITDLQLFINEMEAISKSKKYNI